MYLALPLGLVFLMAIKPQVVGDEPDEDGGENHPHALTSMDNA